LLLAQILPVLFIAPLRSSRLAVVHAMCHARQRGCSRKCLNTKRLTSWKELIGYHAASRLAPTAAIQGLDGSRAGEHAPCYASVDMTLRSRVVRPVAETVGRVFSRLAAIVIGFVLMATGVGLTVTIVMLPAGIVLGLLGVAIFVGGLFARDGSHPF
jgi:hypothetical protein